MPPKTNRQTRPDVPSHPPARVVCNGDVYERADSAGCARNGLPQDESEDASADDLPRASEVEAEAKAETLQSTVENVVPTSNAATKKHVGVRVDGWNAVRRGDPKAVQSPALAPASSLKFMLPTDERRMRSDGTAKETTTTPIPLDTHRRAQQEQGSIGALPPSSGPPRTPDANRLHSTGEHVACGLNAANSAKGNHLNAYGVNNWKAFRTDGSSTRAALSYNTRRPPLAWLLFAASILLLRIVCHYVGVITIKPPRCKPYLTKVQQVRKRTRSVRSTTAHNHHTHTGFLPLAVMVMLFAGHLPDAANGNAIVTLDGKRLPTTVEHWARDSGAADTASDQLELEGSAGALDVPSLSRPPPSASPSQTPPPPQARPPQTARADDDGGTSAKLSREQGTVPTNVIAAGWLPPLPPASYPSLASSFAVWDVPVVGVGAEQRGLQRRRRQIFLDSASLKTACDAWCADEGAAREKFGDIAEWDVGNVESFANLFKDQTKFNADLSKLSKWTMDSAISTANMFWHTNVFNRTWAESRVQAACFSKLAPSIATSASGT